MPGAGRIARPGVEAATVVDGALVMDRFQLLERIGSGGMGTVYRGFDVRLQRQVAIKEVAGADPERVVREAQAAARLNHPGIVTLYELGECDGRAILVSELVEGPTLDELRRAGGLSDRDVAEVCAGLCAALHHAHARGVVHRDVKPQNVVVAADRGAGPEAKLMDFGIARLAGAPTLTEDGAVVGTLAYMSPEQAEGERAGPESDVYSLALTAYECWAGENPVAARSPAETARRIGRRVAPLRERRPDLPEGLADTIDACLAATPDERPSALELADCLDSEAPALDSDRPVPGAADHGAARALGRSALRVAALAALAAALVLIAGPLDAGGLALVLSVLVLPSLVVGLPAASLLPALAPPLAALGVGSAGAALGAAGEGRASRAVLGVGAWIWLLAGSLALGAGPDLGIGTTPPQGWAADPGLAADAVLAPMLTPASLLGAAVFAAAAVSLGWLLGLRHPATSLLGAMIWAAGVDLALAAVGDGALSGAPLGVVAAAALAVGLEFARRRGMRPGSRPRAPRTALAR